MGASNSSLKHRLAACLALLGVEELFRDAYYRVFGWCIRKKVGFLDLDCSFYVPNASQSDDIAVCYREGEELEIFLHALQPGDVAWDVGANYGLWTVFASKTVGAEGCIVAFEPDAQVYRILQKNIRLNDCANTDVLPYALGNKEGTVDFYVGKAFPTVGSVAQRKGICETAATPIHVQMKTAAALVQSGHCPAPTAMKVDVEGAEYQVMLGLDQSQWDKLRLVIIEIHPEMIKAIGGSEEELENLFTAQGFAITRKRPRGLAILWVCEKDSTPRLNVRTD